MPQPPSDQPARCRPPGRTGLGLVSWAFYDWANSSFATVIQTFVFAAYFTRRVAVDEPLGSAQWGYTISLAGLLIAFGGPVLGAVADHSGRRKPWILTFTLICVLATGLLWFIKPEAGYVWPALLLVGLGTIGFEFANIFYNAMLPGLAPSHCVGRWSGWGWSLGYIGGLLCLLLALLAFVRGDQAWFALESESGANIRATFLLVAGWYLLFSLPLFLFTPDSPRTGKPPRQAVTDGLRQLADSLRRVRQYGHLVRFLVARMLYIDGLATVFAFGGVYAAGTFEMNEQQVLLFGIGLNVTAGLGAAVFALLDDRVGSKATILFALVGLLISGALILSVTSSLLFWIFGLILGLFVGPAQASSRSYLARTAPAGLENEMFGLFALSGKATAFLGPLLVGWISYLTGSQRWGMSTVLVFFLLGGAMMLTVPSDRGQG